MGNFDMFLRAMGATNENAAGVHVRVGGGASGGEDWGEKVAVRPSVCPSSASVRLRVAHPRRLRHNICHATGERQRGA